MARPQTRRFGFVDFDAMGPATVGNLDGADEIVVRQNGGDNVVALISQIPAGGVPDPLLLGSGSAAAPTYSFTADPDTGVFRLGTNQLGFTVNGLAQFVINPSELSAVVANGPLLKNLPSSGIAPNIVPNSSDVDTGLGTPAPDQVSLIAGAVEGLRVTEAAGLITIGPFGPLRAPDGTAAAPSYSWLSDPDTGFFHVGSGFIGFSDNGTEQWRIGASLIQGLGEGAGSGEGPALFNRVPTNLLPTLLPRRDDTLTGIGSNALQELSLIVGAQEGLTVELDTGTVQVLVIAGSAAKPAYSFITDKDTGITNLAADQLDFIAGGLSCMAIKETAAARQIGFYVTAPISLQTGVAVSSAGIHAALVALGLITA